MAITNGYATLAEVKDLLEITATADDTLLELAVEAASRQIDELTDRRFWQDASAVARTFTFVRRGDVNRPPADVLQVPDISTSTGLIVKTDDNDDGTFETTWTLTTDFVLLPLNADKEAPIEPWTAIRVANDGNKDFPSTHGSVEITARYGWPAVPTPVKQATLLQAARVFTRKHSPQGIAGFADQPPILMPTRPDPDVVALIRKYRRVWGIV